jgi:hypothetical protein
MIKAYRSIAPMLMAAVAVGCAAPTTSPNGATSPSPSVPVELTPAPSATPSAQVAGGTLQGRVYDDDLAPMAGVMITATSPVGTVTATTDAEGRYAMTLVPATYTVKASKDTYADREQTVTVAGNAALDFGGQNSEGGNPYFMTGAPEIKRVELKEAAPGGPLTLTLEMSEALTEPSRNNFIQRFQLLKGTGEEFLRADTAAEPYLATKASWDAAGRVFTFQYDEPYLAGSTYTARLRQRTLSEKDPVTGDPAYENMRIVDGQGTALGMGRADFAFLRPQLDRLDYRDLGDEDIGYTPAMRRWNLTHSGTYTFTGAKDTTAPGVVSVRVNIEQSTEQALDDVMELHFTEPMRVVKDRVDDQYTLLDKDDDILVVNVSKFADGSSPKPLENAVITDIRFSRTDPRVVYIYFPANTFKDQRWTEVTLGPDAKDPAGNKPDPAKNRVAGPVG